MRLLKKPILLLLCLIVSSVAMAQTAGTLSITFTTSKTAAGQFQPKNVMTVWIATASGTVVKTLAFYARNYGYCLNDWTTLGLTPDVTSGASLTKFGTYTYTWTGLDKAGAMVADGSYIAHIEMNDSDPPNLSSHIKVAWTKGTAAQTLNPTNITGISAVTVKWTPSVVTVVPALAISAPKTRICTGESLTFTATPTNGGTAPSYQWKVNGSNAGTNAATFTTTSLTTGSVVSCVMTSNAVGASPTTATAAGITVTVDPTLQHSVSITSNPTTLCEGTATTFTATPTNGGTAPSFVWKRNGTQVGTAATFSASNFISNDIISCDVTSNASCVSPLTASSSKTLSVTALPKISIGSSANTVCSGTTTTLTASGATSYIWSTNETTAQISVTPSASGSYSVTATANGCSAIASQSITVNNKPTITFNPAAPSVCNGSVVSITASGAASYTWSDNTNGATLSDAPTTNKTYSITATDANGCMASASVAVTVKASPVVSVSPRNISSCAGVSSTLTASGASSYVWSNALGTNPVVAVTPLATASYIVTGTNALGCSDTAIANISISSALTVSISPAVKTICKGESVQLTASGASNYTWSNNGTGLIQNSSPLTSTVFTVTGVDANGCSGTGTANIIVNSLPSITIQANKKTLCEGETLTMQALGAKSYAWSNAASVATQSLTPSVSAVYVVTGTDANNCSDTASLRIIVNPLPQVSLLATQQTVCSGSATSITASGADTYIWYDNSTQASISITPSSTSSYSVTGTSKGCSSTASKTINTIAKSTNTINPNVCGSYSSNGETFSNSGTFTQKLVNAKGCDSILTINLTVRKPSSSIVSYTGCQASYTFNAQSFTQSGIYPVIIANKAGCDSTISLHLTLNKPSASTINQIASGSFTYNNTSYTQSGVYTHHFTNAAGCDSVVTLNLSIQNKNIDTSITACGSLLFNGVTYTQSGTQTIAIAGGGTITLHLTITQPSSSTISKTACGSYLFNGTVCTTSGTYYSTLRNSVGCDSVVTLNLSINKTLHTDTSITACNSYTWEGTTYTSSGLISKTLQSKSGCDSVVNIQLSIAHPSSNSIEASTCDTYTFNNEVFTSSNTYVRTIRNKAGCDSVVTLKLHINHSSRDTLKVVANGSYSFDGQIYTVAGVYPKHYTSQTGCDSVVVLALSMLNVSTLQASITTANNLLSTASYGSNPGQYPASAQTALQAAIDDAKTVLKASSSTESDIATAVTALTKAMNIFKTSANGSVNKLTLINAIAAARDSIKNVSIGTNPGNYPQLAVDSLTAVITRAQAVVDNSSATSLQVSNAEKAIATALTLFAGQEITTADKGLLQAAINSATNICTTVVAGVHPGNYPPAAISLLNAQLLAAQEVYKQSDASQTAVDSATAQLVRAQSVFLKTIVGQPIKKYLLADITVAKALIDTAAFGILPSQYPVTAKSTLQTLIVAGMNAYNDTTLSQAEVNTADATIRAAIQAFIDSRIPLAIRTALDSTIAAARKILASAVVGTEPLQYPQTAYDSFAKAIAQAQAMSDSLTLTQVQIDEATQQLKAATAAFMIKQYPSTNKSKLTEAIVTAKARLASVKVPANYPDSMITKLQAAIATATTVNDNKYASQTEIDAAAKALIAQIAAFDASRIIDPNEIQFVTNLTTVYTSVGALAELPLVVTPSDVTYEWQVDAGSGFVSISTSLQYIGIHRNVLGIKAIPASFEGYKYRCIVSNGLYTDTSAVGVISFAQKTDVRAAAGDVVYLYPSPAANAVTISAAARFVGSSFSIINSKGQSIVAGKLTETETQLDISTLPSGVYYIRFDTAEGEAIQFIKQ